MSEVLLSDALLIGWVFMSPVLKPTLVNRQRRMDQGLQEPCLGVGGGSGLMRVQPAM